MDLVIDSNAIETGSDNSDDNDIITQIKNIQDSSGIIHEGFNKRNKKVIDQKVDDKLKMNIKYERDFKEHLQKKLNKLDNRLNILQMKYNNYKTWYDRFNIIIIIISAVLSVYEALRNELDQFIEDDSGVEVVFNMIPIGMSSSITCIAAIIKFKKYQEKMENMQFTREKVIMAISKIKNVQESLWFNDNENEFDEIKQKYLDDVYVVYNESNSELERHIKFNDHHKFKKLYNPPPPPPSMDKRSLLNFV
tara:strand:- start:1037 stop:1786 length:750 start_codon:yes stop_codon:yes gene_type:complete